MRSVKAFRGVILNDIHLFWAAVGAASGVLMISEPVYAVVRSGRKMYTKMFSKCLGCCEGKAGHAGPFSTGRDVYMRRLSNRTRFRPHLVRTGRLYPIPLVAMVGSASRASVRRAIQGLSFEQVVTR